MDKKQLTLSNGETIHYTETGCETKAWVLLIHGNMSSCVHYRPLIDELHKAFHIIAPDLRGFGDSTYHAPIDHLDDFADDLIELLDLKGIDRAHVAGWSTGGGVGLSLAARYPERVRTLTLIESASYKGYPIFEKDENNQPVAGKLYQSKAAMASDPVQVAPMQQAMETHNAALMKAVWAQLIYNVKVPDDVDTYITETLKQRNLIDVDWALMTFNMSSEHNGVVEGTNLIKHINAPVLSIWGTNDLVIPRPMFEDTAEALRQVQKHVIEGGSHSPITDDAKALATTISTFINAS